MSSACYVYIKSELVRFTQAVANLVLFVAMCRLGFQQTERERKARLYVSVGLAALLVLLTRASVVLALLFIVVYEVAARLRPR